MGLQNQFLLRPGRKFRLRDFDPDDTSGFKKDQHFDAELKKLLERLDKLQYLLYASKQFALLIVLQAMDTGGKDGTIRHVMSGVNPQGCKVTSFKAPTPEEGLHDFLWRVYRAVPERGEIGIFNRSHYEDVLIARVHKMVPKSVITKRYKDINRFEKILVENDVKVLKFFLHISRGEQLKRFTQRLEDPTKQWELSPADFHERKYWNQYMTAYEKMLNSCSTKWAPWYLIPANHKWFRNLAISHIIVKALEDMDLKLPKPKFNIHRLKLI